MFVETTSNAHAGRKVTSRQHWLALFIAAALALTIIPSKAQAQIVDDIEVNIPFQFHAGNLKLPAGQYRIHLLDDSGLTVMEISSADGSTSALFQVEDTKTDSTPAKSELIFNIYGDRYFLAKLFEEGSSSGNQDTPVPLPKENPSTRHGSSATRAGTPQGTTRKLAARWDGSWPTASGALRRAK
jgi:hypothetical protein